MQLDVEIETFEAHKADLEEHHFGKYVVIKNADIVGTWDTMDAAANEAVRRFGRGPYLIRKIGELPFDIPASVFAHPISR